MSGTDVLTRASARLRRLGYLRKWLILGALIGIVAGVGAIAFAIALRLATDLFLVLAGGYTPPAPAGEGATVGSGSHLLRPWAIPLIVGCGGLISGILVFGIAPEAEGHGTDAAISAVHHDPKGVRGRVSVVKIIASAITIGSGGSAGREGPTAQISAGFGSMLARWLDLSPADARIAVTVGIGSGIGAIFRAPLGGAVLGAEVLYREDVEANALIPSLIASIVAFVVFAAVEGFAPIFETPGGYRFEHPSELIYYAAMGVGAGLLGRLYAFSFYGMTDRVRRSPGSRIWKPAIAGLLVGSMAIAIPGVLGTGYGWVQIAMTSAIFTIPLWIVLALPFAKILATSLSIGSGGSGGIFGPGMVIGGFLGAAVWRLAHGLPGVPASPAPFVIVGMIACFGSIAHAPLAVLLMVAEMTGSLEMLAPAIVAVTIATVVVGDRTIYESQLRNRAEAPAHRVAAAMPYLSSISVTEAMRPPPVVLDASTPAGSAVEQMRGFHVSGAPICRTDGRFMGSVDAAAAANASHDEPVGSLGNMKETAISDEASLDAVVDVYSTGDATWVPIVDADRRVVGIVTTSDVIAAYRRALAAGLETLRTIFPGSKLAEVEVARTAPSRLADGLPSSEWVIVSIQRADRLILPHGETELRPGDVVTAIVPDGEEDALRRSLGAETGEEPDDTPMV